MIIFRSSTSLFEIGYSIITIFTVFAILYNTKKHVGKMNGKEFLLRIGIVRYLVIPNPRHRWKVKVQTQNGSFRKIDMIN